MVDVAEKLTKMLDHDNEVTANGILDLIRQNIDIYDVGKDKAKFLAEKKKEILDLLRKYDEEALSHYNTQLQRMHNKFLREHSETQIATENRSFASKVRKSFDRADSHNAIKSKNLGISEA